MQVWRWEWTLRRARTGTHLALELQEPVPQVDHDAELPGSAHALLLQRLLALVERALPRLQPGLLLLEQLAAQVHADLAEVDLMRRGAAPRPS